MKTQNFSATTPGRLRSVNLWGQLLLGTALVMLLGMENQLQAVSYTWTNSAGGPWTTTTNWNVGGTVPSNNTDTATLPTIAGAYTVTVNSNPTIAQLDITGSNATLQLQNGFSITPAVITGTTSSNVGTIDISNRQLAIQTAAFTQGGTILSSGGTIRLGRGGTRFLTTDDTVVDWTTGNNLTSAYTLLITAGAETTVNRSSTWNFLAGQTMQFEVNGPGSNDNWGTLTTNQDMTNSGTIRMGLATLGYAHQLLTINSTNSTMTNNASGVIEMYPRAVTGQESQWSYRNLQAELVNAGNFNIYTREGYLGKAVAGIDHVNSGNITFYNTYNDNVTAAKLTAIGASLTNATTGTIRGTGILDVNAISGGLTNNGILSPGLSAGILNITGNVTNSSTSKLVIELGGTTLGTVHNDLTQYDQLNISGTFAIGGELLVTLINGLENTITDSDTFTIVTYGAHSGIFSNVSGGTVMLANNPLQGFEVTFNPNSIVLSNFFQLPVPEPNSMLLMLGVLGCGMLRRRKR